MTVSNDHLQWRVIEAYPNYEVSNTGLVRNSSKRVLSLNTKKGKAPYQRVHLSKDGRAAYLLVHRLVLTAFVGRCPDGMQCLHIDNNPRNNHLQNLRWGTPKENHSTINRTGANNGRCRLTVDDVRKIRSSPLGPAALALHYQVSDTTIINIRNRKIWKHVE